MTAPTVSPPPPLAPGGDPGASADRPPHSLFRAVRSTALVTLASRIFGLVRDVLLARIFGETALNSSFQFAFAIPNMFRRLFGEGALSAAFIPIYTREHRSNPATAHRLASLTLAALAAATLALTLLVEFVLLAVLIAGTHTEERRTLIHLVMVMLPFMPLICVVAILAGMLQVHGRYAAAATGPLVLNAFIIGVGAYAVLTGWHGDARIAFLLGLVTVLSAATQLAWFLRLLHRTGQVRWIRDWRDPAVRTRARDMGRKFIPVAVGLGTLQLSTFLSTTIATFPIWFETARKGLEFPLDGASNAILAVTSRLYQFPLGVFGIAVAAAAFPLLARHADDPARFAETLRCGLRLSMFIGLPASAGLFLVRRDLTAVLLGYGGNAFSDEGLARASAVLAGFAPGVWAYSLNHVLTRAFYARGDTSSPMRVSIWCMGLNLLLNLLLIWPLAEAGMAWATSVAAIVQCAVMWRLARRRLGVEPILNGAARHAFIRIGAASGLMFLAVLAVAGPAAGWFPATWTGRLLRLATLCTIGLGTFGVLCIGLHLREAGWLLAREDDPPRR